MTLLQAALDFHDAGVCVIPAKADGSKAPIGSWKQYQVTRPSREQVIEWFQGEGQGIGIITGLVSGNLLMVELEGRAVEGGILEQAREMAFNSGLGEIWTIISNGYVEITPSGGLHWLWRVADEPVEKSLKLARRPGANDTTEVLAETRGEGGFVVTSPSHGSVHRSGKSWQLLKGSPASIPMLSGEENEAILSIFTAFDSMPKKEAIVRSLSEPATHDGSRPGDDFNAKATWKEILEPIGWKVVFTSGDTTYWTRPGKKFGVSATTKVSTGNLYVFTTSTTFEQEKAYSKFAAFAHLNHGDDFSEAARALKGLGYGKATPPPTLGELLAPNSTPNLALVPDLDSDHIEIPRERTSWFPKPLDLDNTQEEPAPEFLSRSDGHRLFYRGKINALLGESESGKTWVALLAVKQALEVEQKVIYLDFEDSGRGILSRLRSLGVTDAQFSSFQYANPDQDLSPEARGDLVDGLVAFKPELVIVDGVNAAMTLLGLDLTSNKDATYFSQQLLRPLANSGAAVCTIDHVTKSKEGRGNYAIGAQAKRADINGVAISVEVVMPFGRGMSGELNLKVTKDRPGHVRANSKEAKIAGTVLLTSTADGSVTMKIQAPQMGEHNRLRPTHLMEKVSKTLEAASSPLSKNAVEKAVAGKAEYVRLAIQTLIDEKFIGIENGSRNSLNLKLLKPYRPTADEASAISTFDVQEAENA